MSETRFNLWLNAVEAKRKNNRITVIKEKELDFYVIAFKNLTKEKIPKVIQKNDGKVNQMAFTISREGLLTLRDTIDNALDIL